jgi:DNA gyrase subunit A
VAQFFPPATETDEWLLLTQNGRIKRLASSEISELTPRGLSTIKLKEDEHLQFWQPVQPGQDLILATDGGRLLRFLINDEIAPILSRSAQGNPIVRLRSQENLVGCLTHSHGENLILISKLGYGKQLPLNDLRLGKMGDIGTQALRFALPQDALAGIALGGNYPTLHCWTNQERQLSISLGAIPLRNKDAQGEKLVDLDVGEEIQQIYS